jgi:hypothetical protein
MSRKRFLGLGAGLAILGVVAFFATGGSCSVNAWVHQPSVAAESAETFAREAFVEGDAESAYELLAPAAEDELSVAQLAAALRQMHPTSHPTAVHATDYQSLAGFEGMNIYLEGQAGDARFYYRLLMSGNATSGYKVQGLFRGNGPYPNPEERTPLR